MTNQVLILGNPLLNEVSKEVHQFNDIETQADFRILKNALEEFRKENGFGRGIAAIQIGIKKRIIALNLGEKTFCVINPEITWKSEEVFRMWDDCMSFPDIVVKVERHKSVSIKYQDESGLKKEWNAISRDVSELLQHEIDHLDGILAVERAITKEDIIYKKEYVKNSDIYNKGIEYRIKATIK